MAELRGFTGACCTVPAALTTTIVPSSVTLAPMNAWRRFRLPYKDTHAAMPLAYVAGCWPANSPLCACPMSFVPAADLVPLIEKPTSNSKPVYTWFLQSSFR